MFFIEVSLRWLRGLSGGGVGGNDAMHCNVDWQWAVSVQGRGVESLS